MQDNDPVYGRLGIAFARFLSRRAGLAEQHKPAFERLVRNVSDELNHGHNCIAINKADGDLLLASGMAVLAGQLKTPLPLVIEQNRLYLYRYWFYENRLAEQIKSMVRRCPAVEGLDERLDRYFGKSGESDNWQREAADRAARQSLTMITGGPGTGKTTTVVNILGLLQEMAPEPLLIALAGPTGKAAMRLQESVASNKAALPCAEEIKRHIPETVTTLHRLLGARPPSPYFRHDADKPLVYDLVVVDEASMIDLALMSKLLDALKPSARLILLGDKDQLASIESGAVLADLTRALPEHTVELKTTHRFDENIKRLALLINLQQDKEAWQSLHDCDGTVSLLKQDVIEYAACRQLDYLRLIAAGAPFDVVCRSRARFQVLCANRQGKHSVADINQRVEQRLFRDRWINLSGLWYSGRPVMVTQNDPSLHLYNGDTGLCMPDQDQDGMLMVFFQRADGSVKKYLPGRIPHCETVFAMTIHKSQGSEFDEVLIALPAEINPILTKELLYTAITRARKTVRLVADESVFRAAVRQKIARITGLLDKLSTNFP